MTIVEDIRTFIIQHNVQYLVLNIDHSNEFNLVVIRKLLNSIAQIKVVFWPSFFFLEI